MALVSALFTGVTGLTGNSKGLEILGDNISNVNTIGFKRSRPVFGAILSSILANGAVEPQVGRGTKLETVLKSFNQGAFEASDNALDLAIDGSGFFIVNGGDGNQYTRAGNFRINDSGLVQDVVGNILQGSKITGGVTESSITDIDLAGVQSAPNATTTFTLGANLNAAASAGVTFNSPVTMYNSAGTELILNVSFTKQADSNQWKYTTVPSTGTVTAGASGTVSFDTNGQLSQVNGEDVADQTITIDFSSTNPPADTLTVNWDLADGTSTNGKLVGFAAESNNHSFVQDGFATGTLVGLTALNNGVIQGLFSNGQTEYLYQVALADFLAPSGLTRIGNNLFGESADSGQPIIGTATSGGFGTILGQTLELSNVDLASEFVNLIQTQQAFQASARIINTTDDLLTETVNLVR